MYENLPPNFGNPDSFTDFSKQGPDGIPGQLWEASRPYTSYHSNHNQLWVVGGSDPNSGKGPFSEYHLPGEGVSNSGFWGNRPAAEPTYQFGIKG